jgi:phage terminase large subunit
MRDTQKAYFRERTGDLLDASRRKEREVDKLIKEIIEDRPGMLAGFDEKEETHP